jgi:hypothetical protein
MKTVANVQEEKGNMQDPSGKSSLPNGNINDTGVKNGVGIPKVPGNKNNVFKQAGTNNRKRTFSNERPIF